MCFFKAEMKRRVIGFHGPLNQTLQQINHLHQTFQNNNIRTLKVNTDKEAGAPTLLMKCSSFKNFSQSTSQYGDKKDQVSFFKPCVFVYLGVCVHALPPYSTHTHKCMIRHNLLLPAHQWKSPLLNMSTLLSNCWLAFLGTFRVRWGTTCAGQTWAKRLSHITMKYFECGSLFCPHCVHACSSVPSA